MFEGVVTISQDYPQIVKGQYGEAQGSMMHKPDKVKGRQSLVR